MEVRRKKVALALVLPLFLLGLLQNSLHRVPHGNFLALGLFMVFALGILKVRRA